MSEPQWNKEHRRWYLDGRPIHAGDGVELRGYREPDDPDARARGDMVPGDWIPVRLESRERGRELDAYLTTAGLTFKRHVAGFERVRPVGGPVVETGEVWAASMRWPQR